MVEKPQIMQRKIQLPVFILYGSSCIRQTFSAACCMCISYQNKRRKAVAAIQGDPNKIIMGY